MHHNIAWSLLAKLPYTAILRKGCMHHNIAWGLLAKLPHIAILRKGCMHHNIAWDLLAKITAYHHSTQGPHAS